MSLPCVLLSGAAGYIGSHTWVALAEAGFQVVGLDNFSNSSPKVLERVTRLTGKPLTFFEADVRNEAALDGVFARHRPQAVVHFGSFSVMATDVTTTPNDAAASVRVSGK